MAGSPNLAGSRAGALGFYAPWLVGVVGLTVIPVLGSLGLSFLRWDGLSFSADLHWVGLDHYRTLLNDDPDFGRALANSLIYSLMATPLSLLASLGAAVLLSRRLPGMGIFRTLVYLPHVLGGVATVMIWSWLLNPRFGPVNAAIRESYALLDPLVRLWNPAGTADWSVPGWFYSPTWCKPGLVLMQLWSFGGGMLIFLAALQQVSAQTLEAARLDGADAWSRFRHVILPSITPAILFNTVTGLAASMQAFNQAYLMFNRSQDQGLLFYVLYLYRCAFEPPYRVGYASALAWVFFGIIFTLVVIAIRTARHWVFYEART
ncbi:MAG: carbohydrate ABC transporter permease [Phycisphaerae bacterium]